MNLTTLDCASIDLKKKQQQKKDAKRSTLKKSNLTNFKIKKINILLFKKELYLYWDEMVQVTGNPHIIFFLFKMLGGGNAE